MKPWYEDGSFELIPKSTLPDVVWPAWTGSYHSALLAMIYQLELAQWWPPERLLEQQLRQVHALVRHAAETVPYYKKTLADVLTTAPDRLDLETWRRIPLLTRAQLQKHGKELVTTRLPRAHGRIHSVRSSGSTGVPIEAKASSITSLFFHACNARNHLWHKRDFNTVAAAIRRNDPGKAMPPEGRRSRGGQSMLFPGGPMYVLNSVATITQQVDWLLRIQPAYLLTYPSNLGELARHCESKGIAMPFLRQVGTLGEVVPPDLPEVCRRVWDVKLVDMYSAMEIGMMAIQCPEFPHYHVQSESVMIEILNEAGEPCAPGEVGRVVVTPLHNFAGPLIRYEIGDLAEPGEDCPCGRGLPVIKRVYGRVRNMVCLPNGEKYWVSFPYEELAELAGIRQMQLIQKSLTEIHVKLAVHQALGKAQERRVGEILKKRLYYPFGLVFDYVDEIPRSAGGKYEDFKSEIA